MGNLKKYRKLIDQIKTIDLTQEMDSDFFEKSEQLVNKTIGELMVLTPKQTQLVLKELNEIHDNIKTFADRYWRPDKFDLNNEMAVLLYKRFVSECFIIKWENSGAQMDINALYDIVWRVKYNSTLLVKIRNRIIEPVPENTERIPQQNLKTKYESEFFSITGILCYEFNEDLGLTFDTFNDELFANIDKFKAEINENVTNLNQSDRGFYLKRILERLKKSIGTTILKNKKTGREYPYLQSTFETIEGIDITKVNDIEIFFRLSNDYKNQIVNYISQLNEIGIETTSVTPQLSEKETKQEQPLTLDKVFDSVSKYKYIMELLVKKQFIQEHTYIWKDGRKGYKSLLISILKHLSWQNYYNINVISNDQIIEIAKNTFHVTVKKDTVKHANPKNFNLNFIPLASTLPNTLNTLNTSV